VLVLLLPASSLLQYDGKCASLSLSLSLSCRHFTDPTVRSDQLVHRTGGRPEHLSLQAVKTLVPASIKWQSIWADGNIQTLDTFVAESTEFVRSKGLASVQPIGFLNGVALPAIDHHSLQNNLMQAALQEYDYLESLCTYLDCLVLDSFVLLTCFRIDHDDDESLCRPQESVQSR